MLFPAPFRLIWGSILGILGAPRGLPKKERKLKAETTELGSEMGPRRGSSFGLRALLLRLRWAPWTQPGSRGAPRVAPGAQNDPKRTQADLGMYFGRLFLLKAPNG